ncbi:uncharacterized protein LOC136026983 [Artemia franciscana]|uniref:RRM domain-containing protein n=1 Tax=Artemia franciscana TaxID=6661 RepID=A0AA88KWR0_ARTSF|nr:hypothetical protein QYM36_013769 [Artemia franciscana]
MAEGEELLDYDNDVEEDFMTEINEDELLNDEGGTDLGPDELASEGVTQEFSAQEQECEEKEEIEEIDEIEEAEVAPETKEEQVESKVIPVVTITQTISKPENGDVSRPVPAAYTEDTVPVEVTVNKRRKINSRNARGIGRGKLIGQIKRHERILKHARPDFQKQLQTWAPDQVASNQRPYFIQNHQLPTFQPSLHHHNMFIEHNNPPQGVGLRPPLEPPPRVPERPLPVPLEALIPPPSLHGPPRIPPPQKVLINREYKGGIINAPPRITAPPPGPPGFTPPPMNFNMPPPTTAGPPPTVGPPPKLGPPPSMQPPAAVRPPPGPEPFRFGTSPPRLDFSRPPPAMGITISNDLVRPPWSGPPTHQPPPHQPAPFIHHLPHEELHRFKSDIQSCNFSDSQLDRYRTVISPMSIVHQEEIRMRNSNCYNNTEIERRSIEETLEIERRPVHERLGFQSEERRKKNHADLRNVLSRKRTADGRNPNLISVVTESEESKRRQKMAEDLNLGSEYLEKLKEQQRLRKEIMERKSKGIKVSDLVKTNEIKAEASVQKTPQELTKGPNKPTSVDLTNTVSSSEKARSWLPSAVNSIVTPASTKKLKVRWKVVKDKKGNILKKIRLDDAGNEVEVVMFVNGEPQPPVPIEGSKIVSKKIVISGISSLTPDDIIEDACSHFGKVRACLIFREPGRPVEADVTFENEESASRFLTNFNNRKLDRHTVTVRFK